MPRLLCFGLGFSAHVLAHRLLAEGWSVIGTTRSPDKAQRLAAQGIEPVLFDGQTPLAARVFDGVSHILSSIAPGPDGDPVLNHHRHTMAGAMTGAMNGVRWIGYLSTTGVYGNHDGGWVDEDTPATPDLPRSIRRLEAERGWQALSPAAHIFRLAGIYGPGRSVVDNVAAGTAHRIIKPGHVFSRIHVEDIASVVQASMARPAPGRLYNVCDDEPAEPADVVTYAAAMMGLPLPPAIPFAEAAGVLSPMALSFYADNRRVRNERIKTELGVTLAYPTYRQGLAAILRDRGFGER